MRTPDAVLHAAEPAFELRRHRWPLIALAVVALVAIWLLGPEYTNLQRAADAEAFRELLPDDQRERYLGAGVADLVFAAAYAFVALSFVAPGSLLSRAGAWFVVTGAVFDEAENVFVLANVRKEEAITDSAVMVMRTLGEIKTVTLGIGIVLLLLSAVERRRSRRAS